MADTTLFAHRITRVDSSPVRIDDDALPWMVVRIEGEATSLHIDTRWKHSVAKAEELARAILAGCVAVREAQRRRWNPVDIASLAPDPVNLEDMASTELRPVDIGRSLRTLPFQPDPAA